MAKSDNLKKYVLVSKTIAEFGSDFGSAEKVA
jgi:hypothetical protein